MPGRPFDEAAFVAQFSTEAEALRSGLLRMTVDAFENIVSGAGGRIVRRELRQAAPDYDEDLFVAHIARV
jgi:hypothetical protein